MVAICVARERNIGWWIDYVVVSEELRNRIVQSKILNEVYGSDHCPVMVEIRMKKSL